MSPSRNRSTSWWRRFGRMLRHGMMRAFGIKRISWREVELTFAGSVGWGVTIIVPVLGLACLCLWLARSSVQQDAEAERLRAETKVAVAQRAKIGRVLDLSRSVRRITGPRMSKLEAAKIAAMIDANARLYGFDPFLILAVVTTESRAQAKAMGHTADGELSGAAGMMQVKTVAARTVVGKLGMRVRSTHDLLDPGLNLAVGSAVLIKMIHQYRSVRLGIIAYNIGPTALEVTLRQGGRLPASYYVRVMGAYRQIRRAAREDS